MCYRAVMGISEFCDVIIIVVFEEIGFIKFIKNGIFYNVKIE